MACVSCLVTATLYNNIFPKFCVFDIYKKQQYKLGRINQPPARVSTLPFCPGEIVGKCILKNYFEKNHIFKRECQNKCTPPGLHPSSLFIALATDTPGSFLCPKNGFLAVTCIPTCQSQNNAMRNSNQQLF